MSPRSKSAPAGKGRNSAPMPSMRSRKALPDKPTTSWPSAIKMRPIASSGLRWPVAGVEAMRIFMRSSHSEHPNELGHGCPVRTNSPTPRRCWGITVTPRLPIGAKRLRLQCPPPPSARGRPPFSCCRISSNEFSRAIAYPHDFLCLATVRPWHAGRRPGRCRHVSGGVDTAAVRLGLIISAREMAASRYTRISTMGDCVTFVIFPTATGIALAKQGAQY
jgi:hypothetical protein